MEITKVEFQEVGLDPTKTYIVNLHFDKDCSAAARYSLFKHYKKVFEDKGFTNIIFNPCPETCKVEFQGVKEE